MERASEPVCSARARQVPERKGRFRPSRLVLRCHPSNRQVRPCRRISVPSAAHERRGWSLFPCELQSRSCTGGSACRRGVTGPRPGGAATLQRADTAGCIAQSLHRSHDAVEAGGHARITSQPPAWRGVSLWRAQGAPPTARDALWSTPSRRPDESGRGRQDCLRHILIPEPNTCINCGVDTLARSRPPGRLFVGGSHLILRLKSGSRGTRADRGVCPTNSAAFRYWEKYVALS